MVPHFKIAKNTFYQLFSRLISSGLGFITFVLIARSFGVAGYGEFTKITVYVAIYYLIVDFGLNAIFLREEEKQNHFRDFFILRILLALILIIFANLISLFLPYNKEMGIGFSEQSRTGILLFSITILTQAITMTNNAVFQKKLRYVFSMLSNSIGSIVTFSCVVLFIFLKLPLIFILSSYLIGGLVTNIISSFLTKKERLGKNIDLWFIKKIFIQGIPLGLTLIFNLIYFRIDMILLSSIKSASDVGIYGFSYKFFDFIVALPFFLSNSLYPVLLEHRNNYRIYNQTVKKYFFVSLFLSMFLTAFFWFLAPLISIIKYEFYASIEPFRILLLSLPFFFTTCILQWALIVRKQQIFLMVVYFLATLLNIVLNIIFIPIGSYMACAIITLVGEGVVFLILLVKTLSLQEKFSK